MKNTFTTNIIKKIVLLVCIMGLILGSLSLGLRHPSMGLAESSINAMVEIEWESTFGGPTQEISSSLIQTADGGFAILGRAFGEGRTCILFKTNANGQAEWNVTLLTPDADISLVKLFKQLMEGMLLQVL